MDITESDQIFKNGVKHIRLDCKSCKKFQGYKPQPIDIDVYKFPFGKHKDLHIYDTPLKYLNWLCTQDWLKDNLRDAINDYLDSEE